MSSPGFSFSTNRNTLSQLKKPAMNGESKQTVASGKTKLIKKYTLGGFQLTDLVWMRPADGRYKFEILVRYIDPEAAKTKRDDGSYQKVIKFGTKGYRDYVDPPHSDIIRQKNIQRFKANTDNPLHQNFYVIHVLNGTSHDSYDNFNQLKRKLFS